MDGRHRRRRTAGRAGMAAMLPALFLGALYVAAPFAGTTTHAIAYRTAAVRTIATGPSASSAAPDGTVHPAQLIGSPIHLTSSGGAVHTMVVWYVGIVALAIAVVVVTAAGALYRAWLRH
jgi:hypothetical protein